MRVLLPCTLVLVDLSRAPPAAPVSFVVRGEHAAYLEDDDAEDFFAPGAKHALTRAGGARVRSRPCAGIRVRD